MAGVKELAFTCELKLKAYKQYKQLELYHVIQSQGTVVLIDYFSELERALFITASHLVTLDKEALGETDDGQIAIISKNPFFTKTPLPVPPGKKDHYYGVFLNYLKEHGGYLNLTILCYNTFTRLKMKEPMYAYPVELRTAPDGSEALHISQVAQYQSQKIFDIALVWAKVNSEFKQLINQGRLKPITLPETLTDGFKTPFNQHAHIQGKLYRMVRAGGLGNIHPLSCSNERPIMPYAPFFANFGVKKFGDIKHSWLEFDYTEGKWTRAGWRPIDDDQVFLQVIAEECRRHCTRVHGNCSGVRSVCYGDSGGPAFLPTKGNPTLIGILTRGQCTHEKREGRNHGHAIYILVSNTMIRQWISDVRSQLTSSNEWI